MYVSNILKDLKISTGFFCHIILLKVQINPRFPAQKHLPAVIIYLLPRAFWCWWFWQHALGPCTAWHNAARLRKPPWRNTQRAKYTIKRDVEPKNTVQNWLKGTLVFSVCVLCKQMFYIWVNCKEEQQLCPSTSSNQKWIQQQVFVWCANIHEIHMGTKCRTHSVFQKAHWVYFQKDPRYENHLRQSW